jgi:hypothetical protein
MKWIPILFTVICINAVSISTTSAACVDYAVVKTVQVNANGDVLFKTWDNERVNRLAATADSPARDPMLHLLVQAVSATEDKGYKIAAVYPEGYNCKKGDSTTPAKFIKVYDPVVPY